MLRKKISARMVVLMALMVLGVFSETHGEVVLRVGMDSSDAGQLDPHLTSKTPDMALLQWIFNGLTRFKPGSMDPATIESDLAEKWTSSPDGRIWTFTLRKGVKFHGGYGELTAEDVVFSWSGPETRRSPPFQVTSKSSNRSRRSIPRPFESR